MDRTLPSVIVTAHHAHDLTGAPHHVNRDTPEYRISYVNEKELRKFELRKKSHMQKLLRK